MSLMMYAACGLTTCVPGGGAEPGIGYTGLPFGSVTEMMPVRGMSLPPLAIAP